MPVRVTWARKRNGIFKADSSVSLLDKELATGHDRHVVSEYDVTSGHSFKLRFSPITFRPNRIRIERFQISAREMRNSAKSTFGDTEN